MQLAPLAGTVGARFVQHVDAQLRGRLSQHRLGHGQRVFQKRAQVTHRRELHGETKPMMLSSLLNDQRMVGVVQMKIPSKVMGRRRVGVAAVVLVIPDAIQV